MAKKKEPKENKNIISKNNEIKITTEALKDYKDDLITIKSPEKYIDVPYKEENIEEYIKTVSISELMDIEKACALVCRKYETSARLNDNDNFKFNKFKDCYHYIFKEIEERIEIIYKQMKFVDEKN